MTECINLRKFWFALTRKHGVGPRKLVSAAYSLLEDGLDEVTSGESPEYFGFKYYALLGEFGIGFEKGEFESVCYNEEGDRETATGHEIWFHYPGSDFYPDNLLYFADKLSFSPAFYSIGNQSLLCAPGAGLAGMRDASKAALDTAAELAKEIANQGYNLVSGMARGVDLAAHLGALEADGTTTAVVPFGLCSDGMRSAPDCFSRERDVLVVSLVDSRSRFSPANAFARNRMICALSRVFVVLESGAETGDDGKKSGTFDAAKQAFKAGIPVFVLTPSIFDSEPQGNVQLIRMGAREFDIRDGAGEIIEQLGSAPIIAGCEKCKKSARQPSLF